MKTATAWSGRASGRSAHKIAEKMAKSAGVDFDSWVEDAVVEYAEDLGVDPEELTERERLEAIEERIDRAAREPAPAPRRAVVEDEDRPRRRYRDADLAPARRESPAADSRRRAPDDDSEEAPRRPLRRRYEAEAPVPRPAPARNRLDQAIEEIEARAQRQEARAARALESMSAVAEDRSGDHDRLEQTIQEIEKRAERNESRTARALESLTGLVEGHGGERGRLEAAINDVEKRAERNEERTARALQGLHGLVEARSGEGERLQAAIAEVEARAERRAARTAQALESLTGLVEARKEDRERLETALERAAKRAEASEARASRAIESLSALTQAPPADAVASRFDDLARRAARTPEPSAEPVAAPSDDDETFRLVSERLARRRKQRPLAPPPAAPQPESLAKPVRLGNGVDVGDIRLEMRRLADRVESLATPARNAVQESDAAAEKAAVARIEGQLAALAERVERLGAASSAPAEVAAAVKALADTRAEVERGLAPAALQAAERRLEELAGRVEAAARRPAPDARPLEDLGRRIEALRTTLERQSGRPDAAALAGALGALNEKLDHASTAGSQSAATLAALQGAISRLEAGMQRPTAVSLDPRPIEELTRRIEGVRGLVERQGSLAPKVDEIQGAISRLEAGMQRPTPVALDPRPIEELTRRIDGVRGIVERQGGLAPKVDQLHVALGELTQKFERAAASAAEIERLEAALGQMGRQVEAALGRSATVDPRPLEDLGRRIDAIRKAVESNQELTPQVARLETALAEIRARIDRPAQSPQIEAVDAALRQLAAKFDQAVNRPVVAPDPRPMEDLARRIDSVRGVAERGFAPHAARLEASLGEIHAKLDRPAQNPEFDAALRELALKFDEAVSRPATIALDAKPIEELARRIESVRESLDRPQTLAPQVERLETALGAVADRLDRAQPMIDAQGINSALATMTARLEEAFRRPVAAEMGGGKIDALAARFEAVRETVERQSEQFDVVGRPIDALARRVESLSETVERQSEQLDSGRLAEAFRTAVDRLDRPALTSDDAAKLIGAVKALAEKIGGGALFPDFARVEDLLETAIDRLDRPGDIAAIAEAVAALGAKIAARDSALAEKIGGGSPAPDFGRVEELLETAIARLDRPGDIAAIAEAVAALGAKIDRTGAGARDSLLADIVRDVALRLDALDEKLDVRAAPQPAEAVERDWTQLERAVRELTERMGELRVAPGGRAIEQELSALHDKLDDLAEQNVSGGLIGRAADAIARDLGQRFAAANPEALIGHLQDIHQRLDVLSASRPALNGFEETMRELTEELEAFRSARDTVTRGATTLSEMRAEQLQIDRRMDARFTGVQDVLEKLVDRIGQSPRGPLPDAISREASPMRSAPVAGPRTAMLEIPDRLGEVRPSAAPTVETAPIAAQGRARETAEGGAVKSAAINTHIAAARRAANAAAADNERREELDSARKAAKNGATFGGRAQALLTQHQRPILLGAAGLMTVLAGVAFLEFRSAHAPVRKSEIDIPAAATTPLADLARPARDAMSTALDTAPLGSVADPKVISSPLPAPSPAASASQAAKPAPDLVAALPSGVGSALAAAASRGEAGAEVEIAQRYLEGRTVPRDPKSAAAWMQAAADAGNPFAIYRLGAMYEKGVGVARDAARARELYTKAGDAGNARAMHNLAVLYAQDGGAGKPDYATAISWFVKAANYGVRDSQFNLGVLYGRGLGATQDLAASWMWFSVAAKQGDADAARKRDEVANRMDGRAMASAKKMFDDFKVKTPDPAVNDAPPAPADATADAPAGGKAKAATKS